MSIIDELAAAFDIGKKVLSGEKTVEQLGEEVFGENKAPDTLPAPPPALEGGKVQLTRVK
jgi:hypothetical protein